MIELIIDNNIKNKKGKMFCFCLSISVKNNTDVTIRPLKIKIGTVSKAQPGAKKTSIVIRSKLVKVISFTN